MAGMRVMNELTKGSEFPWMTDTYIWQDDAACAFSPPTMFEVAFEGDPIAEGLSVDEIKDLNSANIEAAKKVCNSCPVWHLCYSSSAPNDFRFTVRAGVDPLAHKRAKPEPKEAKPPRVGNDGTTPCSRGHMEWFLGSDGYYRCRACRRDAERSRVAASKVAAEKDRSEKCKRDHDPQSWVYSPSGSRWCRECERELRGASRRNKKRDTNEPCRRGHMEWRLNKAGYPLCRGCEREDKAKQMAKRRAKVKA